MKRSDFVKAGAEGGKIAAQKMTKQSASNAPGKRAKQAKRNPRKGQR